MVALLKKLILFKYWWPLVTNSIIYHRWKKIYAKIARIVYENPAKDMFIIWVTGTDGKTTTSNIIHHIINQHLGKTALVTTALIKFGDEVLPNTYKMTSLDPFHLWKIIQIAKDVWCTYLVLEVASHGIHQHRFEWIDFDMAVLTNITPEHLDYHKTFENYVNTKKELFLQVMKNKKPSKIAILPKDDDNGRKWIDELFFDKMLSYSINTSSMVRAENIDLQYNKTTFTIDYLWKPTTVNINLPGTYNVYNTLAAIAAWLVLWVEQEKIAECLTSFEWVVWRMEPVTHNGVRYFVDFAHTPNALKSALAYVNAIKWEWRNIVVFWAPGNRDRYKRPEMGKIAAQWSDIMIITDDDPDTEPRLRIIQEIAKWVDRKLWDTYMIIPERELAIKMAVDIAKPGDLVLLAWKWHEHIQLTNFGKRPWSDRKKLEEILGIN